MWYARRANRPLKPEFDENVAIGGVFNYYKLSIGARGQKETANQAQSQRENRFFHGIGFMGFDNDIEPKTLMK